MVKKVLGAGSPALSDLPSSPRRIISQTDPYPNLSRIRPRAGMHNVGAPGRGTGSPGSGASHTALPVALRACAAGGNACLAASDG
jgi:hypothetical protein